MRKCFLCGRTGNLDRHHIFGGPFRKKSEKYGLTVDLCHDTCHIFGPDSAHQSRETALILKRYGQKKAMQENGWSKEGFIREFGKNYLEE